MCKDMLYQKLGTHNVLSLKKELLEGAESPRNIISLAIVKGVCLFAFCL